MSGTENLKRILDQICRDKGIDRELLVDAIEEAVRSAVRKKYGIGRDIEVQFNEELGEIEVFQYRTVVEEVWDEEIEISLEEARQMDPNVEVDDDLGEKMTNIANLGRIAAQSAKQVIIHRMRDAEREVVYELFRNRVGTVVNGIVQRFERGNMVLNLGRTDAILPREGQIPKRSFKQGDRVRAYLLEVKEDARDTPLILSRTCNEFLIKLFEMEVPEIAEDIVKIMGAAREPGFRAKIAVSSTESDVDPVGACVGMKGSRVQNVVQELQGERIDIVPWSPDPAKYVYNALAPADVTMVIVDEDQHSLLVVVPNDQLSLAIGRQGQNVRLASRLLAWRIDVKSEQRYENLSNPGYMSLLEVDGVNETLADKFMGMGLYSSVKLAGADLMEIMNIAAVDEDRAATMKLSAADVPPPVDEAEKLFATPEEQPNNIIEEVDTESADTEQEQQLQTDESQQTDEQPQQIDESQQADEQPQIDEPQEDAVDVEVNGNAIPDSDGVGNSIVQEAVEEDEQTGAVNGNRLPDDAE